MMDEEKLREIFTRVMRVSGQLRDIRSDEEKIEKFKDGGFLGFLGVLSLAEYRAVLEGSLAGMAIALQLPQEDISSLVEETDANIVADLSRLTEEGVTEILDAIEAMAK